MAINIFQTKISLFSSFSSASFFFSIFCSCLSVKSLITRCTVIFLCSFSVIARGKRFLFVLYVNTWQPNQRTYTFNLLKEKVYSKQRNSSANFMCFFAANIEICCEINRAKIVKKMWLYRRQQTKMSNFWSCRRIKYSLFFLAELLTFEIHIGSHRF